MVRRALLIGLVALSLAVPACGGSGSTCDASDSSCDFLPPSLPTDAPTDTPTDSPTDAPEPTPTPLPAGCVDSAELLFPTQFPSANYAGTMYVSVAAGEIPGSFLALQLVAQTPNSHYFQYETGSGLQYVTGPVPAFVPSPGYGYAGVYASSNLPPPPPNDGISVQLIDTRNPSRCDTLDFGKLGTSDHGRALRSVRRPAAHARTFASRSR